VSLWHAVAVVSSGFLLGVVNFLRISLPPAGGLLLNRHNPTENMIQEFKTFIARGNVMDLAVAVIIGAAFGRIVESVVKDIITPVIGMLGGQPDFSGLKLGSIMVGNFLNAVLAFVILAAVIFFVFVKPMNRLKAMGAKRKAPEAAPEPTAQEKLLAEIRDLLKQRAE
jgi:large conductance mechanosensitive channel